MTARLALVTIAVAAGVSLHAQPQPLQDLLTRAADYHAAYTKKVSGVSLEEQTRLMDVSGGVTRGIVRISADVVLTDVSRELVALRDIYAIDTRPTRQRTPRLLQLLGAPATPSVQDWVVARAFPGEDKVYFLLDIVIKVNQPTSALRFIETRNQPLIKYKLDGRKKMNDADVVGVRFEEIEDRDRTYLLGTRGNARATGRFWIDPATGAIHQTELWVDSNHQRSYSESAIVSVKYAPDTDLGVLLPSAMNDSYEEFDASGTTDPQAGVGGRRSVQSTATYKKNGYAPIDLTKLRRN